MPAIIKSIRNSLLGELTDFVTDVGFGIQEVNLLADLVYELSEYREEGVACYPTVYLLESKPDSAVLKAIAPSADQLRFGEKDFGDGSAAAILKSTAPLAEGGWSIFIESDGHKFQFGIFRSEASPVAVSSSELFQDESINFGKAILLRNCSSRCVELLTGNGTRMEFSLTSAKARHHSVSDAFTQLAEQATIGVEEYARNSVREYLRRAVFQCTQQSHGTLIVVVPAESATISDELSDGVTLESELDIAQALREVQVSASAESLSRLLSREALLRGMIQSDGITVFSSNGKVKAFRVFVKPNKAEHKLLDAIDIKGGARSRAHELLKLRLGTNLNCVLFSSQDGNTVCTVKP